MSKSSQGSCGKMLTNHAKTLDTMVQNEKKGLNQAKKIVKSVVGQSPLSGLKENFQAGQKVQGEYNKTLRSGNIKSAVTGSYKKNLPSDVVSKSNTGMSKMIGMAGLTGDVNLIPVGKHINPSTLPKPAPSGRGNIYDDIAKQAQNTINSAKQPKKVLNWKFWKK